MFGYIRVCKPEMKVKDFEIYNAVYCGLCRKLGKTYGVVSKLFLNYDLTFLALLQMALTDGCDGYEQKRCRANPFKKCTYCKNDSGTQELAAAALMSLTDMKVKDNIADEGFFLSAFYRFIRLFTRRPAKKAFLKYPALEKVVSEYLESEKASESLGDCGIDRAAEPTAKAVEKIFAMLGSDEKSCMVLGKIGYMLGKWIYLCDAADDIVKDRKKGSFNPLLAESAEIPAEKLKEYAKIRLEPIMNTCMIECRRYSELLDLIKYKAIIDNILYFGLPASQKRIFNEEQKG